MIRKMLIINPLLAILLAIPLFLAGCAPAAPATEPPVTIVESEESSAAEEAPAEPADEEVTPTEGAMVDIDSVYEELGWPPPQLCHPHHPDVLSSATEFERKEIEPYFEGGYSVALEYKNFNSQIFLLTFHGRDQEYVENYLEGLDLCLEVIDYHNPENIVDTTLAAEPEVVATEEPTEEELKKMSDDLAKLYIDVQTTATEVQETIINYIFDPEITNEVHVYGGNKGWKWNQPEVMVWVRCSKGKVRIDLWSAETGTSPRIVEQKFIKASDEVTFTATPDTQKTTGYLVTITGTSMENRYKIGGGWMQIDERNLQNPQP